MYDVYMSNYPLIHAVLFVVMLFILLTEPHGKEGLPFSLLLSLVPFFGALLTVAGCLSFANRAFSSKGKCILGHKGKMIDDGKDIVEDLRNNFEKILDAEGSSKKVHKAFKGSTDSFRCEKCNYFWIKD